MLLWIIGFLSSNGNLTSSGVCVSLLSSFGSLLEILLTLSFIKSIIEKLVNKQIPIIINTHETICIPVYENNLANNDENNPPRIPPPTPSQSLTWPNCINSLIASINWFIVSFNIAIILETFNWTNFSCIKINIPIVNKYIPTIFCVKNSGHDFLINTYPPIIKNTTKRGIYNDPTKNSEKEVIALPTGPYLPKPNTAANINNTP